MPRTAAQSAERIRELEARNRGLAAEIERLCAILRSRDVLIESQQQENERIRNYGQQFVDRAESLAAERDVLRRVVRAADYWIVAGQSLQYDEAREALTKFDIDAQKVIVSACTGLIYERIK